MVGTRMTKRKPLPAGYCPDCGVQYLAPPEPTPAQLAVRKRNHERLIRLGLIEPDKS